MESIHACTWIVLTTIHRIAMRREECRDLIIRERDELLTDTIAFEDTPDCTIDQFLGLTLCNLAGCLSDLFRILTDLSIIEQRLDRILKILLTKLKGMSMVVCCNL